MEETIPVAGHLPHQDRHAQQFVVAVDPSSVLVVAVEDAAAPSSSPRPVPASYVGPRLPLPGTPRVRVRQEAVRIDLRGGIPRRMEVGGGMGMMMCFRFAAPAAAVAGLQRAVGGGGRRAAVMVVGVASVGPGMVG